MTSSTAKSLNTLALWLICLLLLAAYAMQFSWKELPCPLCLLQRAGLLGVGIGLVLNLRFGTRPSHYGLMLLSALYGGAVSIRQILLHIVPGTGSYGTPIFGLHLYTWALLLFVLVGFLGSIMLLFDRQFEFQSGSVGKQSLSTFAALGCALLLLVATANIVTTLLECGFIQCPDNPLQYNL